MNIVTWLSTLIGSHGGASACETVELRRWREQTPDVRIFFRDKTWLASAGGRRLLEDLSAHHAIAEVRTKKAMVSLRLSDPFIAI
jgi:hypothetical protein